MSLLPVEPAWRLAERKDEHRWLIAGLWSEQAVGIVGSEPKCCKSFLALALDIAVAVAAGIPCLRRFAVPRTGRVLLYAAEDALHIVRRRFDSIYEAVGVALADLDIQVITAPTLRLDLEADRNSLAETVARLQPRLLILDPFVRLHRIDENASGEVAPLLAYLRELQSRYGVAVLVVHHARKGVGNARAGQALRGSSEFHAWGDSNLYLRRDGDDLTLTVEHRAAPSPIAIALAQRGPALALEVVDPPEPAARARARSTSASPQHLPTSQAPCPSPSCATAAASAPPPCTSASPPSPTPAASSRPTMATASPATDSDTFDNHDKTRAQAPNPLPLPGLPTASGNGIGKSGQGGIAVPHP